VSPTSKTNVPPAAGKAATRAASRPAAKAPSLVPAGEIAETIDPTTAALFERARVAEAASVEKGVEAWREVAQKARRHRTPLRALARLYEQQEQWAPMAETLRKEAALASKREDKRALLQPLVAIYRDKLHLGVRAIAVLQQILQLAPRDLRALDELAALYEQLKRWTDLIAVLRRRAPLGATTDQKVATWLHVADLYADRVGNKTQAIEAYLKVLELDPGHTAAIAQLKALYEARRDWGGLIELSRKEIALLDDPAARASRYAEAARLATSKIENAALAMDLWSDVLGEDPWNEEALAALEKLSEKTGDWQRLAGVLRHQAESSTAASQQVELLEKLAFILETRLSDAPAAIASWRSLLEIQADHPAALRALERLLLDAEAFEELESIYAAQSRWKDLARVLERRAGTADPDRRPELLLRAAAIYSDELDLPEEAARAYEMVLAIDPDHVAAAEALIPFYETAGEGAALARVLEVRLAHTDDGDARRALLARVADLYAEDGTDASAALGARLRHIHEEPEDPALWDRAEKLARRTGEWAALATALEATWADAADRTRFMPAMLAAVRAHEQGGNHEAALRVNALVLELDPEHALAFSNSERLCALTERWDDLEAIYRKRIDRADAPAERKRLLLQAAALYRDRWDDAERARRALYEALDLDVADGDTVLALAALEAGAVSGEDTWGELGARPIAIARGGKRVELAILARIYREGGHWQALADLLRRADAVLAEHPADHVALLLELARVQEHELEQPDRARTSIEQAVAAAPDDPRPLDALAELCRRAGDWQRLARVSGQRSRLAREADERARLLLAAADAVAEETGAVEHALDLYQEVLRLQPQNDQALAALERFYRTNKRWAELLEILGARCEATADAVERIALELQAARLCADELRDTRGAIAIYEAILATEPTHAAALEALADLYQRTGRMGEYLELLGARLESAETDEERVSYCRQIAAVHANQLARNDLAARYLERAFALDRAGESYRELLAAYRRDRRFEAVADVIARHVDATESSAERVAAFLELGQLRSGQLADVTGAIAAYRAALELDADNVRALDAVAILLEERAAHEDAAAALARLCAASETEKERAAAHYRLGCLKKRRLGDPAGAETELRKALESDPSHADAAFELAEYQEARGAWDAATGLLVQTAAEASDPRVKARLLARAGDLCERELDDSARAAQLYALALDNDPGMAHAGNALVRICEAEGRHEELLEVLELLLGHADRHGRRWLHALHLKLATTAEALNRYEQALEHYQAAWELDPTDVPTLVGMTNLRRRLHE